MVAAAPLCRGFRYLGQVQRVEGPSLAPSLKCPCNVPPGCGRPPVFRDLFSDPRGVRRSTLGETQSVTPMVVPVRGYLDDIRRMMVWDYYIGRGSRERNLRRIIHANER